jgi:methylase of polypeptide subunit release factors
MTTRKKEFGDFQTPAALAQACVARALNIIGWTPALVLEPTCGVGAFVSAAAIALPKPTRIVGVDINPDYVARAVLDAANAAPDALVQVHARDFFLHDWQSELGRDGRALVLGNPPWVTSSMLGALQSQNLPQKSNFQGLRGLDALTGKANFDISEWMLLQYVSWLHGRRGAFAVLCKTAVARKIARQVWSKGFLPRQAVFAIDAKEHFGVAVDACMYVVDFCQYSKSQRCAVYDSLEAEEPRSEFGIVSDALVSNVEVAVAHKHIGGGGNVKWRSGVKHDCSPILELSTKDDGLYNALGERVEVEENVLFPLAKCADVNAGVHRGKYLLLPQTSLKSDTSNLESTAPQAWEYLSRHADRFSARASRIYKGKGPFSVFGVGDYTLKPWKVAIGALYKHLRFAVFGPDQGRPVVFDDTVYFLGFDDEESALAAHRLLSSEEAQRFLDAHIFWTDKRPITTDILNRLNLETLAALKGEAILGARSLVA